MSRTRRRSKLAKGRRSRKNGRSRKQTRRGSRRAIMRGGGEDDPTVQPGHQEYKTKPKPDGKERLFISDFIDLGEDKARPPLKKSNFYNPGPDKVRPAEPTPPFKLNINRSAQFFEPNKKPPATDSSPTPP